VKSFFSGKPGQSNHSGFRLYIMILILLLLLSLSLGRFFILQVAEGDSWQKLADRQHLLKIKQPFFRGTFWLEDPIANDRIALSYDLAQFHLFADCSQIKESEKLAIVEFLHQYLYLNSKTIQNLTEQLMKSSRSRRLLNRISLKQKKEIDHWWKLFAKNHKLQRNSLFFLQDQVRAHSDPLMLSPVVHTTQLFKNETSGQAKPTGGLELFLDARLQGKGGWRFLKRTLKNPLSSSERFIPAVNGADITLTMNPRLQVVAENILQQAVSRFQAENAWAMIIDPYSGKILCLAQAPFFDLAHYSRYFNDSKLSSLAKIWGVNEAYEPGSVLKPINLAIALRANERFLEQHQAPLFDPLYFVDLREVRLPGRRTPLRDVSPANFLNMDLALQKSSNIYMAKLMQSFCDRLNAYEYQKSLQKFGFGQNTGIELPSEALGLVPQPGKVNAWGALEWSAPTPSSLAMGHNILTTSIQLLRAYCAIANGGWLIRPTIIEKVDLPVGYKNEVIYKSERDVRYCSPKILSHTISQRVLQAMSYTLKPMGSAIRADLPGYSIAVKTGTANKIYKGKYDQEHSLSTLIGILPLNSKKKLVILVSINEPKRFFIPGQGYNHRAGFCAAPTFHRIAQQAVAILGIDRDAPESFLPNDPRFKADKSYWVEQNRNLQEMYRKWNSLERSPPGSRV
jgi:cell division protein FtsI (penicillin-binding protein 3)